MQKIQARRLSPNKVKREKLPCSFQPIPLMEKNNRNRFQPIRSFKVGSYADEI